MVSLTRVTCTMQAQRTRNPFWPERDGFPHTCYMVSLSGILGAVPFIHYSGVWAHHRQLVVSFVACHKRCISKLENFNFWRHNPLYPPRLTSRTSRWKADNPSGHTILSTITCRLKLSTVLPKTHFVRGKNPSEPLQSTMAYQVLCTLARDPERR